MKRRNRRSPKLYLWTVSLTESKRRVQVPCNTLRNRCRVINEIYRVLSIDQFNYASSAHRWAEGVHAPVRGMWGDSCPGTNCQIKKYAINTLVYVCHICHKNIFATLLNCHASSTQWSLMYLNTTTSLSCSLRFVCNQYVLSENALSPQLSLRLYGVRINKGESPPYVPTNVLNASCANSEQCCSPLRWFMWTILEAVQNGHPCRHKTKKQHRSPVHRSILPCIIEYLTVSSFTDHSLSCLTTLATLQISLASAVQHWHSGGLMLTN